MAVRRRAGALAVVVVLLLGGALGFDTKYAKPHSAKIPLTLDYFLSLDPLNRLNEGHELIARDRLALMLYSTAAILVAFVAFSRLINPRTRKKKAAEEQRRLRIERPWKMLSFFNGTLYLPSRSAPSKESRLMALHKLACSSDTHTSALSVSSLCFLSETLSQKSSAVLTSDLALIAHWGSAPAPSVAQRVPLALAMLLLCHSNRERVAAAGPTGGVVKAIVAGARAANKHKQAHAALAVCVGSRSLHLAGLFVQLGALEAIGSMLSDARALEGKLRVAAAFALAKLCEWPVSHRHVTKLAYLRSVVALCRASDPRLRLCAASVFASLAAAHTHATGILDAGALAALVPLAVSPSIPIQAQACRALRHLVGGRQQWLKRLRTMCASADETYGKSVWELRKATVLAGMPLLLSRIAADPGGGAGCLDVVYRSLGYEDADDTSVGWNEEAPDDLESEFSSAPTSPSLDGDGLAAEGQWALEGDEDGSSDASARATPRVSRAGEGENDPMLLPGRRGGEGRSERVDEEEGKGAGRGSECWGREFSSFTHKKIVTGIRALSDWHDEQEVAREASSLVSLETMMMLVDLSIVDLPFLVIELKRLHTAEILGEGKGGGQTQEEDLQDYSLSACRPIESTLNIITILKKEALVLGRERADDARDRRRRNFPSYAYYEENPMIQFQSEDDNRPTFQMSDLAGSDATLDGDVEMKGELSIPLKEFLVKYHSDYVTDASAASHTKYYPRNGKKPELIVNKQFARDAPSILRINGQEPSGEGEEEQVRAAYHALVQGVGGSTEKAQRVSVVANQNLGVYLYEHVVNKFADDLSVSVMQAGQHHVDIRTSRRGVVVVFVALFRLQPNDADEQRGDLVKGSVRVDYIKKQVSLHISDAQKASK